MVSTNVSTITSETDNWQKTSNRIREEYDRGMQELRQVREVTRQEQEERMTQQRQEQEPEREHGRHRNTNRNNNEKQNKHVNKNARSTFCNPFQRCTKNLFIIRIKLLKPHFRTVLILWRKLIVFVEALPMFFYQKPKTNRAWNGLILRIAEKQNSLDKCCGFVVIKFCQF